MLHWATGELVSFNLAAQFCLDDSHRCMWSGRYAPDTRLTGPDSNTAASTAQPHLRLPIVTAKNRYEKGTYTTLQLVFSTHITVIRRARYECEQDFYERPAVFTKHHLSPREPLTVIAIVEVSEFSHY
ncbi:hypothetical protein J6590_053093 [Homalodisca vitripennis]|nr:hypothetical protein J6590_053093 [Homalodisca vitripennis]